MKCQQTIAFCVVQEETRTNIFFLEFIGFAVSPTIKRLGGAGEHPSYRWTISRLERKDICRVFGCHVLEK